MKLSELRRKLLERIDPVDVRIILRLATGLDDIHQITESGKEITEEEKEKQAAKDTAGCRTAPYFVRMMKIGKTMNGQAMRRRAMNRRAMNEKDRIVRASGRMVHAAVH